ncbi:MAG TPA: hypothetical protein DDZ39_12165 [Flavobacteriaceae bacterium]|jgi:glucose/arabinose dehydrogenase|nr:hypothetical protein [Flavobacteriaceae bacterium]HBS11128.1 hypothetical protein [Flavobacteriaceae bacterium]
MKRITYLFAAILMTINACAQEHESSVEVVTSQQNHYTTELVISELDAPWGMAFLPDESILVTERAGKLILFKDKVKTVINGLPKIKASGQGGLMDVELHPDYETNGWIYLSYASEEGEGAGSNTAILRAKLKNNSLVEQQLIYKASPNSKKGHHFGSRITFDKEGYLYFSIGDRGNRDENPQDITRDGGKIYRLNDDGSIPSDNPFVDDANAKKAIYSYGHRNPQGMTIHPETGEIWTHEHGPKGGDEINIINKNKNYGWPKISYGINYDGTVLTEDTDLPGMEQPLFYWVPSIAPSGFTIVSSDKYPDWKNDLLVGSLKFQYIERLVLENNKVVKREKLFEDLGRIRSIKQAPNGFIYIGVENVGVVRIIPKK